MVIFDIPNWLEIPVTIGLTFLMYAIGLLIGAVACFILGLVYFLFQDKSN